MHYDSRSVKSVAAGFDSFLVMWNEWNQYYVWHIGTYPAAFRVFRSDGTPRLPVETSLGSGNDPTAIWNGEDFFVITSLGTVYGFITKVPVVWGMRVDPDGRIIEGSKVPLSSSQSSGQVLGVAWNGERYLAAATPGLLLIDRNERVVKSIERATIFGVVSVDRNFAAGEASTDGLRVLIVSPAGDIVKTTLVAAKIDRPGLAAIAAGGGVYGVVWIVDGSLQAATVDANGQVIRALDLGAVDSVGWPLRAAWIDDSFAVLWRQGLSNVCSARFGAQISTAQCTAAPSVQFTPGIASNGRTSLLAWVQPIVGGEDPFQMVEVAFNPPSLVPNTSRGGVIASEAAPSQMPGDAVDDDEGALVAWTERSPKSGQIDIHLGGLGQDVSRRPEHIISTDSLYSYAPRIARAGTQTLVVWSDVDHLRAARVTADGTPVDPRLELVGGNLARVASDGENWLVVRESWSQQILSTQIMANGTVVSPGGVPISPGNVSQRNPTLDWNGRGYLVAWIETDRGDSSHQRLMAQLLDRGGTPSGPPITIAQDPYVTNPAVACASECFIAWWQENGLPTGIRLAVIDPAGSKVSNVVQLRTYGLPVSLRREQGNVFRLVYTWQTSIVGEIGFTADGTIVGDTRFVVEPYALGPASVTVGGRPWIIYSRLTTAAEMFGGTYRLFARPATVEKRRRTSLR
jgi:hypothetical protein